MKQVIIRIQEAKVTELMDQFVGRIERVACLLESSDKGDTKRVGVVAVFRRKGEELQVLMGKREYEPEAGKWALPGGHIKEGEDLDTGARREIKEETGLELDGLKKLRTRPGNDGETVHIYGTLYTGTEKAEADDETAGVKWMNVDKLPDGLAWDNNELIPKLAKEMAVNEGALLKRAKDFVQPKDPQYYKGAADDFFKTISPWLFNQALRQPDLVKAASYVEIKSGAQVYADKSFSSLGRQVFLLHLWNKIQVELGTWKKNWQNAQETSRQNQVNESITFRETNHDELEQSGVVQHFGDNAWGDFSHYGEPFLILLDDRPVGWFQLTGQNKLNAIEVKPEFQKQGIATEVLRQLYGGKKPSVSTPPTSAGKKLLHKFNEAYAGSNAAELNSNQPLPAKRVMVYRTMHQPWATEAAQNMRDKFGINVWVDGTVTTGWGVYVHAADGERGRRMFLSLLPLGGTPPGLTPGLGEAAPIDVRKFMLQNKPSFIFKHSTHQGEQVFLNAKNSSEAWPLPIGCVSADPQGQWFIVSGNTGLGKPGHKWTWWETEFPNGRGGVNGPRFNSRYSAALQLWLNYKDVSKA